MKGISKTLSTMIEDEDASLSEVIGNRAWTWDFTEIGFIMNVDLSEMCRRLKGCAVVCFLCWMAVIESSQRRCIH